PRRTRRTSIYSISIHIIPDRHREGGHISSLSSHEAITVSDCRLTFPSPLRLLGAPVPPARHYLQPAASPLLLLSQLNSFIVTVFLLLYRISSSRVLPSCRLRGRGEM